MELEKALKKVLKRKLSSPLKTVNKFVRLSDNNVRVNLEYDECEKDFFATTIEHLKTPNLTIVEWRKIRRLIMREKSRRFSDNFIKTNRIALAQHRRRFEYFEKNKGMADYLRKTISSGDSIISIEPTHELLQKDIHRLLVKMKRMLCSKRESLSELRNINDGKPPADSSISAIQIAANIETLNESIAEIVQKMWSFAPAKNALLLQAAAKGTMNHLTAKYFRLHCQVGAYDSLQENDFGSLEGSDTLVELMEILLEMIRTATDRELLGADAVHYFDKTSDDHLNTFQELFTKGNIEYVETVCLPTMFRLLKKIPEPVEPLEQQSEIM